MSFGDIFNIIDILYKAVEQDPISFMVVYPMTLITSSMLIYALVQDFIPVYKARYAPAAIKATPKRLALSTAKRSYKAGKQVQFSN